MFYLMFVYLNLQGKMCHQTLSNSICPNFYQQLSKNNISFCSRPDSQTSPKGQWPPNKCLSRIEPNNLVRIAMIKFESKRFIPKKKSQEH
jgi:hypothetical protein